MPKVLTTNAVISCPHGGKGTSTPSEPIWSVDGGLVLVENDAGDLSGCGSNVKCKSYVLSSMGLNATRIRGKKVILVTDFNITNTGLPLVMTELHRVIDNSSPAPLVNGQAPPPLPPPMADEDSPDVTCSLPSASFQISAPAAPLITSFTLKTNFPLKWVLTLIKEPTSQSIDLTTTTVAGVTIAPPPNGGAWNVSQLDIQLTLDLSFLNGLVAGDYRFYMTGISQRGLSGNAVFHLSVVP
ncbi:MAG TPA: hypothetical protein VFH01_03925 [Pyrinomonadaceae bacterium]|nr:hypothetical protein [Pyrinomonadaceae bacterium]